MSTDREGRQPGSRPQPGERRGKRRRGKDLFGPGAVGAWTEEELANIPPWSAPPEEATRDQEDSDALRRGIAIEGRRKAVGSRKLGEARPYGAGEGEPKGSEQGSEQGSEHDEETPGA
jgi:hypothetical protein